MACSLLIFFLPLYAFGCLFHSLTQSDRDHTPRPPVPEIMQNPLILFFHFFHGNIYLLKPLF